MKIVKGEGDKEIAEITRLARQHNIRIVQAFKNGKPVVSGLAYQADNLPENDDIWVECSPKHGGKKAIEAAGGIVIDHHEECDEGYEAPPEEHWGASSLSKIMTLMNIRPTKGQLMISAADHSLVGAYSGVCKGIDKDALLDWRIKSKSLHIGVPVCTIKKDFAEAMKLIANANYIKIGDVKVLDLSSVHRPMIKEACCYLGKGFLTKILIKGKDLTRWSLMAAKGPEVQAFLELAKEIKLKNIFGSKSRGFAGGYQ